MKVGDKMYIEVEVMDLGNWDGKPVTFGGFAKSTGGCVVFQGDLLTADQVQARTKPAFSKEELALIGG